MTEISIRPASAGDIDTLVSYRLAMFRDMGWTDEVRLDRLAPLYGSYVEESLASGDFVGWIAEEDERPVGAVGLLWERVPPTVRNLGGRQAYVLGLFVEPAHRRRGIARSLVETAISHARAEGADVVSLHSSDSGRGLYESLGFVVSPEMRLFTDPTSAAWAPEPHTAADDAD